VTAWTLIAKPGPAPAPPPRPTNGRRQQRPGVSITLNLEAVEYLGRPSFVSMWADTADRRLAIVADPLASGWSYRLNLTSGIIACRTVLIGLGLVRLSQRTRYTTVVVPVDDRPVPSDRCLVVLLDRPVHGGDTGGEP
jgi:hypothetical protein